MPFRLETAEQVIRFIEGLSYCVDRVDIVNVRPGGFSFKVQVPGWYRICFSKFLSRKIKKEVGERMFIGIDFDFEIYSESFF